MDEPSLYPIVEHATIEVHSFHSLGREIKISPYTLADWMKKGWIKVIAFNHQKNRNVFAISKKEVERIAGYPAEKKRLRGEKANAEREKKRLKLLKKAQRKIIRKLARKYK